MTIRLHDLNSYKTKSGAQLVSPFDIKLGDYIHKPGSPIHGFRVVGIEYDLLRTKSRLMAKLEHEEHPGALILFFKTNTKIAVTLNKPTPEPITPFDFKSKDYISVSEAFYKTIGKHFYEPLTVYGANEYFFDGDKLHLEFDDLSANPRFRDYNAGPDKFQSLNNFKEFGSLPREVKELLTRLSIG